MANPREHLEDWLRDAYAMERQAEMLLAAQLKRLDHYPQLQDRLRQHLDDTIGQQALVEACLMRLGTTPSAIRAARIAAYGRIASGMLAVDEVVKGALAGYAFAHVEIAAYTALAAAAQAAGEAEIHAANGSCNRSAAWPRGCCACRHDDRLSRPFGRRSHRCEAMTVDGPAASRLTECVSKTCRRLVNNPLPLAATRTANPPRTRFDELARSMHDACRRSAVNRLAGRLSRRALPGPRGRGIVLARGTVAKDRQAMTIFASRPAVRRRGVTAGRFDRTRPRSTTFNRVRTACRDARTHENAPCQQNRRPSNAPPGPPCRPKRGETKMKDLKPPSKSMAKSMSEKARENGFHAGPRQTETQARRLIDADTYR